MDLLDVGWEGMDWIGLVQDRGKASGCCECDNEHLGSIKCGECLGLGLEILASREGLYSVELLVS
jgi:hypothetical protein